MHEQPEADRCGAPQYTYNRLPSANHDPLLLDPTYRDYRGERHRWSFHLLLLPYIEQKPLYDELMDNWVGSAWPDGNSAPPTKTLIDTLICPSDAGNVRTLFSHAANTAPNNYHANRGDQILGWDWHESRGPFARGDKKIVSFASVTDGTSNTMAVAEVPVGVPGSRKVGESLALNAGLYNGGPPSVCLDLVGPDNTFIGDVESRGWLHIASRWMCGHAYTLWFPLLPPNGPSCANDHIEHWALITAGSRHPGGCNVLMLDGSVRFVRETIDAGDPTRAAASLPPGYPPLVDPGRPQDYAGPSLYGVWGAMGSMAGGESVQMD